MTDTPLERVLHTIQKGFTIIRNTRFNYTNEYWYNLKSYVCGSESSFSICEQCNNYKHISNNNTNSFSDKIYEGRKICDCKLFVFHNKLHTSNKYAVVIEGELCCEYDNFTDDFIDIVSEHPVDDLKRSVVF
jgi:hypothetical protein